MAKQPILIIEDNRALATALAVTAEQSGFVSVLTPTIARAKDELQKKRFSAILLDIGLPDGNGLEILRQWNLQTQGELPAVAVITAHGEIEAAIEARKLGAQHFFDKPVDFAALKDFLAELKKTSEEHKHERKEKQSTTFVGASRVMRAVFQQIAQACATTQPVVISGESGTGKSLVARMIHNNSQDPSSKLITLYATASIKTEEIIYLLEQGSQNVLLIENIHTLSDTAQKEIAQSLHNLSNAIPRLIVTVDEQGLRKRVIDKSFDADLYYQLQLLEINLPPLRERVGDISAIASFFLGELSSSHNLKFSEEAIRLLEKHEWPGNLRELQNAINYAIVTCAGNSTISAEHLPSHISLEEGQKQMDNTELHNFLKSWIDTKRVNGQLDTNYKNLFGEIEAELLKILLEEHGQKQSRLAKSLSLNRATLRKKLQGGKE